jgi:tRNA dimethylallyltransferase
MSEPVANQCDGALNWRESPPLVVLLGATAVGKTNLSLEICERFGGEVVGADSRQIYVGMDIGTAKPSAPERARVPHHLIDIRTPDEALTVAEYQRLAYNTIGEIHTRGTLPVLAGGTILYVRAVVEGFRIPEAPPNPALREELETLLEAEGREALFELLSAKDPATAAVIDARNPRRLIRALEIVISTGKSKVELESANPPAYSVLKIGLDRSRERLYERIDARVDRMIKHGLVDEVRSLLAAGYDAALPAMTSLGYREIAAYLQGDVSLEEAAQRIKIETHRYVRHQYTWLRKMKGVSWVDMDSQNAREQVLSLIGRFLQGAGGTARGQ